MRAQAAELFEARRAVRPGGQHGQAARAEASGRPPTPASRRHGGFGFAEEYDVERKFRENRLYHEAPIHNNLILAYLGQHVLGMPKSY